MSTFDFFVVPMRPDWLTYGNEMINATALHEDGMSRREVVEAATKAGIISSPGEWRLLAMQDGKLRYISQPFTVEETVTVALTVTED